MSDTNTPRKILKVGLILIGDELLNGSRQDKHMAQVIALLKPRGLSLAWVRMVADEHDSLVHTLQETFATPEIVFSFGGIGATPDDLTRTCAADALGVSLVQHPDAVHLIEDQFGDAAYPNRILMSYLAEGAAIIPNPINQVPGFSLQQHHFVPGFPSMAWPMVEWVLETHYSDYFNHHPDVDWRWTLTGAIESELLDMMNTLLATFPEVGLSSLPNTQTRHVIDFGLKGSAEKVAEAAIWLENYLDQQELSYQRRD
jgi:molybdopterin-biosynthesis enzyme MoeA-like protein